MQTKEKHEVDFVLIREDPVEQILEVKASDSFLHPDLRYFHEKYGYPAIQLVAEPKREYQTKGIQVRDTLSFLQTLAL